MPRNHQVAQGECLASIASLYGFSESAIWDDPANADLKAKRKSGYVLFPGDVVVVPDAGPPKTISITTGGTTNRFRLKKRPDVPFHLVMKDGLGVARAGVPYTLTVGRKTFMGNTSSGGEIDHLIPAGAQIGTLTFGKGDDEDEIELQFGHLDPITEVSGVKQRLLNLGFDPGPVDDQSLTDDAKAAIEAFQRSCGLEASGEIDDPTRKKLEECYGS